MAIGNPQMESFLQNSGDAEAQQAALAEVGDLVAIEMAGATDETDGAAADEEATAGKAEPFEGAAAADELTAQNTKALHEARGQHKAAQARLHEAQGTINTMNQRFAQFVTHVQGGEQPGGDKTSLDDDPVQNLDGRLAKLEGLATNFGQQQQMNTQLQAANNQIQAAEAQFAATTPDYGAAVLHVQNLFVKDLQMRGVDPMTAVNQVRQEMGMAALQVLVAGQDPAAVLYERAKAFGYQAKSAEPKGAIPLEERAARLIAADQGQKAKRSPGSDGGRRSPGRPENLEDLAGLSEAEIFKNWDRIMGPGPVLGGLVK